MASSSSSSSSSKKMITLQTYDGELFEVEENVCLQCLAIKHLIEDDCVGKSIPLQNVHSRTLVKVIEYCKKHIELGNCSIKEAKNWDEKFVKEIKDNQEVLFDLIHASNYLEIKSLLDLLCKAVADMMKGKTPEQIRSHFHIVNDYTKEEEEEVRRENQWAFE